MPNQKSTSYDDLLVKIKKLLPTGKEIYDSLMAKIEPDLVSANISLQTDKYKDEQLDDRKKRIERYKNALNKYDEESKKFFNNLDGEIDKYRVAVEEESKNLDEGKIQNLEDTISNN